jgi:predicted 2-oxoglutarate/Fe(II)-dependent dioxygenase YbiX
MIISAMIMKSKTMTMVTSKMRRRSLAWMDLMVRMAIKKAMVLQD